MLGDPPYNLTDEQLTCWRPRPPPPRAVWRDSTAAVEEEMRGARQRTFIETAGGTDAETLACRDLHAAPSDECPELLVE